MDRFKRETGKRGWLWGGLMMFRDDGRLKSLGNTLDGRLEILVSEAARLPFPFHRRAVDFQDEHGRPQRSGYRHGGAEEG